MRKVLDFWEVRFYEFNRKNYWLKFIFQAISDWEPFSAMRLRNLLFCPELSFPRSIPRGIVMTDPARRGRDVPGHAPAPALPTRTGRLITTTRGREIPERREKEIAASLAARNPEIPTQRSRLLNPQIDKVLDLFKSTFRNPPQPGNWPTPAFYYDTCSFTVLF